MSGVFRRKIGPAIRPHGKEAFLKALPDGARVLDVGCGNNSPLHCKQCAPSIHYTGLAIGDYNQETDSIRVADEYVLTTSAEFASTWAYWRFETVIWAKREGSSTASGTAAI
jgi:hypothetical protein